MNNEQLEETQPYKPASESNADSINQGETRQSMPVSEENQPFDQGQTIQTTVSSTPNPRSGYEETMAVPAQPAAQESPVEGKAGSAPPADGPPDFNQSTPPAPRKGASLRWVTLLGVLLILVAGATSAFGGYQSGIHQRTSAEATQISARVQEQFDLGVQDMEAHRFDLARQRFEYVISLSPEYPGVTEKLADVLLELNTTATPTLAPTPTLTPTPDTRGVDELFTQAQEQLANQDWTTATDTLFALRKADPNYQPVWVDDMLYISFRNRGVDKILKSGDLEGGIYDLTVAEQIGPLDADAKGYLTWARLYITGASFWELDWSQAVYYFAQVAPALPNLRDGSGWTATERYRLALVGYGQYLSDNKDWCNAAEQLQLALTLGTDDKAQEAYDLASQKCSGSDHKDDNSNQSSEGSSESPTQEAPPPPEATQEPPPPPAATATEPPPADATATP